MPLLVCQAGYAAALPGAGSAANFIHMKSRSWWGPALFWLSGMNVPDLRDPEKQAHIQLGRE